MKNRIGIFLFAISIAFNGLFLNAQSGDKLTLENSRIRLEVDSRSGAISSFFIVETKCEMIGEPALISNFRIGLPLDDYQANYIDGMKQKPKSIVKNGNSIVVSFSGMASEKGVYPIDLIYTITLHEDYVSFKSRLTNNFKNPVAEFWFPRLGGWTKFGDNRNALLATPNYNRNSRHEFSLFKNFPGGRGLGAEAAEWAQSYPAW
jgi:hypothetical protein